MAKLYFYYGAMGSAKTANAIITAYNYEERGQRPVCLKPALDTRTDNQLRSRLGLSRDAIVIHEDTDVFAVIYQLQSDAPINVVIVDEVQFLQPKHIWQLARIVDELNVPVLGYGLRSDFQGNLFPGSAQLLAIADEIREVKTMCWCGKKAIINTRLIGGQIVKEGEQVLIGGNDSYTALCRKHYMEERLGDEAQPLKSK